MTMMSPSVPLFPLVLIGRGLVEETVIAIQVIAVRSIHALQMEPVLSISSAVSDWLMMVTLDADRGGTVMTTTLGIRCRETEHSKVME